jgi:hypothetical protein
MFTRPVYAARKMPERHGGVGGLSRRFSQEESMCGSQICCKVSSGRCCGWIYEMKVARMQLRRMHPHERDRIARIVNGDHRISVGVVLIAHRRRQLA